MNLPRDARVTPNDALGGGVSRLVVTLSPDLEGRVVAKAQGHSVAITRSASGAYDAAMPERVRGLTNDPRRSFRRRDGRHGQRATDSELEARR